MFTIATVELHSNRTKKQTERNVRRLNNDHKLKSEIERYLNSKLKHLQLEAKVFFVESELTN